MATPVLFYCPRTRADTAMWMNEELGGVCDIKIVNLRAGDHKKPDFLSVNPMGKMPAMEHDGVIITETAAICAYLADIFSDKGFAPPLSDPGRGAYYRWLFYSPSVVEPMMLDKLGNITRDNVVGAGHGTEADVLKTLELALADGEYLLGAEATAADIVLGSTLNYATMFGAIEKKGAISDYIDLVTSRPAYARMRAVSAKYAKELGFE